MFTAAVRLLKCISICSKSRNSTPPYEVTTRGAWSLFKCGVPFPKHSINWNYNIFIIYHISSYLYNNYWDPHWGKRFDFHNYNIYYLLTRSIFRLTIYIYIYIYAYNYFIYIYIEMSIVCLKYSIYSMYSIEYIYLFSD